MRNLFLAMLMVLAAQAASEGVTAQERRIALLIGNQNYDQSVGVLKNPHNDVELVGEALRQGGYEVMPIVKDARRSQILQAVRQFASALTVAGPGSIGLLYYSGHGAAERETNMNYVIPIDARDPGTTTFWDDSLKLDDILRLLERAQGAAKFVIFDACRNELQLPTRDTNKGLLPVNENHGLFLAYATAPGRTASDKGDRSGPYAAALAAELRKPGLDHLNLFQNVKEAVIGATGGAQQPWENNGLSRRVFLTGQPKVAAANPAGAAVDGASQNWSAMSEFVQWEIARSSENPATLERFLQQFPTGVFASTARQMLDRMRTATPVTAPPASAPAAVAPQVPVQQAAPAQQAMIDPSLSAEAARLRREQEDEALVRSIQTELNRVGCSVGAVDGEWGIRSQNALREFARRANITMSVEEPSTQALEALVQRRSQVCAVTECDDDERLVNGRCVTVARPAAVPVPAPVRRPSRPQCDDDERLVNGRCVAIAKPKPQSRVRDTVLKAPPPRPRQREEARAATRATARPAAAGPRKPTVCFGQGVGGRGGMGIVACDDPRALR